MPGQAKPAPELQQVQMLAAPAYNYIDPGRGREVPGKTVTGAYTGEP
jgi:hypothetical protein